MFERFFHKERAAESAPGIPLDKTLFGRLDDLLGTLSGKDKELLGIALDSAKKKSFRYMEETLDEILRRDNRLDERGKEHDIAAGLTTMGMTLSALKIPHDWPAEREKALREFKTAALSYALERGLEYEKRVFEKREDKGKVLEEMRLASVVEPEYIEGHIVGKIDALPAPIKENLLAVEKPQ